MDPTPANEADEVPHQISVACEIPQANIDPQAIIEVLRVTLDRHGRGRCNLSIAIVDDHTMADLHERHLGIPGPTDVLTYDLRDTPEQEVEGEIVIGYETAARESAARSHPVHHEVLLYVVHGLLHLLGYDDHDDAAAAAMHACEDEMLAAAGIGPVYGRSPA